MRTTSNPSQAHPTGASEISDYLMEGPREGERLEAKTNPDQVRRQLRRCGFRDGMSALDVGCGTGAVSRIMSAVAGLGRVVGVDANAERLQSARDRAAEQGARVEFVEGDAYRLPFPDASFDFTWCRFVFEYLQRPADALAEMKRVTRPGGKIAVADLDGQILQMFPLDGSLESRVREALGILGRTGFDPDVGRTLFQLFVQAGLREAEVYVAPYHVYTGGIPESDRANWKQKFQTVTDRLVSLTGRRAHFETLGQDLFDHMMRADVFYYSSLITVAGRR